MQVIFDFAKPFLDRDYHFKSILPISHKFKVREVAPMGRDRADDIRCRWEGGADHSFFI